MRQIPMPAVPYMMLVKMYAESHGLKFWTASEQKIAIASYEEFAKRRN